MLNVYKTEITDFTGLCSVSIHFTNPVRCDRAFSVLKSNVFARLCDGIHLIKYTQPESKTQKAVLFTQLHLNLFSNTFIFIVVHYIKRNGSGKAKV